MVVITPWLQPNHGQSIDTARDAFCSMSTLILHLTKVLPEVEGARFSRRQTPDPRSPRVMALSDIWQVNQQQAAGSDWVVSYAPTCHNGEASLLQRIENFHTKPACCHRT
jgi:hypothetical protein